MLPKQALLALRASGAWLPAAASLETFQVRCLEELWTMKVTRTRCPWRATGVTSELPHHGVQEVVLLSREAE